MIKVLAAVALFILSLVPPQQAQAQSAIPFRPIAAPNGGPIRMMAGADCNLKSCTGPTFQGSVGGYSVTAVLIGTGTNGQADRAHVFVYGYGGNGGATADLGIIPAYQNGDRMDVLFIGGKMYLVNEIYLPGEAHCCASQVAITKWAITDSKLSFLGMKKLPITQRSDRSLIAGSTYNASVGLGWISKVPR